ncbi:ABC transporter ATP-binding protein [Candidatus Parcubacteria bacterium]|nr:ABC transporter ATP-binding protein [Candidatus Parcubacteria bacterium]
MNALGIQDLTVRFGNLIALSQVSLTVQEHEIVALIGPSGCGKSTLLRATVGIVPGMVPTAHLEGGIDLFGKSPIERHNGEVDMVFQESCLLPWRTTQANIRLGLEILGRNANNGTLPTILEAIGLTDFANCKPRALSGGMRQRASLATSLVTHPKLLLMDEPFANLDSLTREQMWQLVEHLHLDDKIQAALLVTHSIEEAVALADRVLVMSERPGQIIGEVVVRLPRPRITPEGLLVEGFGAVANQVRRFIRHGGEV